MKSSSYALHLSWKLLPVELNHVKMKMQWGTQWLLFFSLSFWVHYKTAFYTNSSQAFQDIYIYLKKMDLPVKEIFTQPKLFITKID